MRCSRVLTLVAGAALVAACGNSNTPSNTAPVAAFDPPSCTLLACNFVGTGTDADGTISAYAWNFGEATSGSNTASTKDAAHTFAQAGTFTVQFTVTDNDGGTNTASRQVTVSGTPPANQAPTADFTSSCSSLTCTFTDASSDPEAGPLTSSWNFGDGSAVSTETSPVHTYSDATLTTHTVTLTVTDNAAATATKSADVTVAPSATLTCGSTPDCNLVLDSPRKVTVTLVSSDCQLSGNTFKVMVTPPGGATVEETLFTDGCNTPDGTSYQLQSNATFAAGTTIAAEVISGGNTIPLELPPARRVTGSFPNWTLEFDDGAKAGPPPEPDYNDLIITIAATP